MKRIKAKNINPQEDIIILDGHWWTFGRTIEKGNKKLYQLDHYDDPQRHIHIKPDRTVKLR